MQTLTGSISTYVFSIVRARPMFLLLYRAPHLPHANTWQAVHGMIEPAEKAYDAGRREMREECGLTPARFFKTDFVETFYSETTDAVHLVPAFAAYVEGAPAATLSEEHTAAEWCTLDDAVRRFVWPSQQQAVRIIAAAVARWPDIGVGVTELNA
ncbi:MAG TPA: NUDIX domain-containing protein [Dehalococcoidia bacterium]|nr:NUDIX domain-containing protein [Dehalococcoidia bacterium]